MATRPPASALSLPTREPPAIDWRARAEKVRDLAMKIEKHARELQEGVRTVGSKLDLLLRKTKLTLKALNVEPQEAAVGTASTIALPPGSLGTGRAVLLPGHPFAEAG